ncbi:MAG: GTPase ObgE, partial [Nitrospinae bacterium]|nr:GTPase ObgE [Nitrospinota bacterium]
KGLGIRFLKHIERTKILLHLIDMSAWEGRDHINDFKIINEELLQFSPKLASKPQMVVGNKVDIHGARERFDKVKSKFRDMDIEIFSISAVTGEGVNQLVSYMADMLFEAEAGG